MLKPKIMAPQKSPIVNNLRKQNKGNLQSPCTKQKSKSNTYLRNKTPYNQISKKRQNRQSSESKKSSPSNQDKKVLKKQVFKDRAIKQIKSQQKSNKRKRLVRSTKKGFIAIKKHGETTSNSKRSSQVIRLQAENQYFKMALSDSREKLDRLQKVMENQKLRRKKQKQLFQHQINHLKKQISTDKVRLGHIFSFDSFNNKEISNIIVESENQGSSLIKPRNPELLRYKIDQNFDAMNQLSVNSK